MIENTLVSEEIFKEHFVCNLKACKGQCCVLGDSGAPLEEEETKILQEIYPKIKSYLTQEGQQAIEQFGTWIKDNDGDLVTPLVDGLGCCAYVYFDETHTAKCGIESAFNDGVVDFKKPISCHLYPIRISKKSNYEILDYHVWNICSDACSLGKELKIPVFRYLREPLIRKYGREYFQFLEDFWELEDKLVTS